MRALRRSLRAGLAHGARPDLALRARGALRRWGPTPAAACRAGAIWTPGRPAVIDEEGVLSFGELDAQSTALACALQRRGLRARDTVVVMCRNSRWPLVTLIASSKLGLNITHVSHERPASEVEGLLDARAPRALICDGEFADRLALGAVRRPVLIAHTEPGEPIGGEPLAALVEEPATGALLPPSSAVARTVTFTGLSGGEHTVRGSLLIPGVLGCAAPLQPRRTTIICVPVSLPWGHLNLALALRLNSTIVLRRRFDPVDPPLAARAERGLHNPPALCRFPA